MAMRAEQMAVSGTHNLGARRGRWDWVAIVCVVLAVSLHLINTGIWQSRIALTGPYSASGRVAWSVVLKAPLPWLFFIKGDTKKSLQRSDLQLFDGMERLGPAHTSLADVQELGAGRYLHWKNKLVFSRSNNADPHAQPTTLAAVATISPRPWLVDLMNWMAILGVLRLCMKFGLFSRLETVPIIGWAPRLTRVGYMQIRLHARQISAYGSVLLSIFFCSIVIFGVITRFDVVRVTEKIDFVTVGAAPTTGYVYQVRRPQLYRPFMEIAPIDTRSVVIRIDGVVHPCVDTPYEASRLGEGRCSYVNGYLLVSAPDNANIADDGRAYVESFPIRLSLDVIHGAAGLAVFFALAVRYATSAGRWVQFVGVGLATAGLSLTVANLVGMHRSLRHPDLMMYGAPNRDVTITYEDARQELLWRTDDTTISFSSRATATISRAVLHNYLDKDFNALHVYIPIWENWILHFQGLIKSELREYVFQDPNKELERGIGLCGDVSAMLTAFLVEHGINAQVVGLSGHVVATAEVAPGEWYILDPDNGIIIPHDLASLEKDNHLVRFYYRHVVAASGSDPDHGGGKRLVDLYVDIFTTPADNHVNPLDPHSADAVRELWAYRLKWILPLMILVLGGAVAASRPYVERWMSVQYK